MQDQTNPQNSNAENGNSSTSYKGHRRAHSESLLRDENLLLLGDVMDAKKAMAPDKLAELWALDPKRAKRPVIPLHSLLFSGNWRSIYADLRDTTGLTSENTELKLRLQAMEQQAQLRDALNEALKQEVERLKVATGEAGGHSEAFNMGMHYMPYNSSSIFSLPQQPGPGGHQNMQFPQFHPSQSNMMNHSQLGANSRAFSEMLQQDQLGRFQGLDISTNRESHSVKSEGPSISASGSNNAS
ncbi:hypothetical protein IFM89_033505 [Coptis chinensis]|uniref:Uncharacterized protein n=1 Tax=Coptis chinensis TaxID=261450 RepID=A0A835LH46_9MAGN|nr:hypothetical protein IFM89_033505 [Coptis chinensis]